MPIRRKQAASLGDTCSETYDLEEQLLLTSRVLSAGVRARLWPVPDLNKANSGTKGFFEVLNTLSSFHQMEGQEEGILGTVEPWRCDEGEKIGTTEASRESPCQTNLGIDSSKQVSGQSLDQPTIHSEFATPLPLQPIVIRSSDNIHYHTSLYLLKANSTFFKDIIPLKIFNRPLNAHSTRVVAGRKSQWQIIDFPTSPSSAITPLLQLLNGSADYLRTLALQDEEQFVHVVEGLFDICEIYEFHNLPIRLSKLFPTMPFITFALSASTSSPELASCSERILMDQSLDPFQMPYSARKILEVYAPGYLYDICKLANLRYKWWCDLTILFKVDQPADGRSGFGKACRKSSGTCTAYHTFDKDFYKVRSAAADTVLARLRVYDGRTDLVKVLEAGVEEVCECRTCISRLRKTFKAALDRLNFVGWSINVNGETLRSRKKPIESLRAPYLAWTRVRVPRRIGRS